MANEKNLKPFVKGDPRINRKGRPKSFDALRKLVLEVMHEEAKTRTGKTLVINNKKVTQIEAMVRDQMKKNPLKMIELGYGKVPDETRHTGADGASLVIKVNVKSADD